MGRENPRPYPQHRRPADAPDRPLYRGRRLMPLVELIRLPNGVEAGLLRGRLESAGVPAVCFDAGMNIADSVGLMIPVDRKSVAVGQCVSVRVDSGGRRIN